MDLIAKAVAAAEKPAVTTITLGLPSGRQAFLSMPEDLTLQEAAAMALHIGGGIHQVLQAAEQRRTVAAEAQMVSQLGNLRA